MVTTKKTVLTVAQTIYKGSYNLLCKLESEKKITVGSEGTNIEKVLLQLEMFNKQKPFCKLTSDEIKKESTISLLTDETAKKNFTHLLNIAKEVYQPKLVW